VAGGQGGEGLDTPQLTVSCLVTIQKRH